MIVDPWGTVLAQAPDGEGFAIAELDLERARARSGRRLPALANRRPEAYAGREDRPVAGCADGQGTAGRPTPADPRRRGARLRPPGLPRLPRLRHRRRGGRRLRARLPLLRFQGGDAEQALHRALVAAAARRSRRSTAAPIPAAREARRGRRLHHRLLPPRPGADEGDHRRGHPGGELVRRAPTCPRSARPTT